MTLVSAAELADLVNSGAPVRILDVRWSLTAPDGRDAYEAGHIPGAVYVDLEADLSDHSVAGRGRHPLPSGQNLEKALRDWGVDEGDAVVVYDDWNRAGSARAWWVLRAAGLRDVRVLDGGWAAWIASGGSQESGGSPSRSGSITVQQSDLQAGALPTLTAAEAARTSADGVLLDARAPERYRGEVEPVDPVAGHIPGAVNLPSTTLLDATGAFLPVTELREAFRLRGVTEGRGAGVYCGSGVTAAVVLVAADIAGVDLALFPGSWSQWASDPANPVEVGS